MQFLGLVSHKISQQTWLNKYLYIYINEFWSSKQWHIYICVPQQSSHQNCLLLQTSLKYSVKNNGNCSKEILISMYHEKWRALSKPPTASHGEEASLCSQNIDKVSRDTICQISEIKRIISEAVTTITLNEKARKQMWHTWEELEKITKIYWNNLPIRNKRKKRNGKNQSGSKRHGWLKVSHTV